MVLSTKKILPPGTATSASAEAESEAGPSSIATTVYESSRTATRQEFAGGATHITEVDTAIEK